MTTDSKCIPIAAYARTNNSNTKGSLCGSIQEQLNAISYWARYNNCKVVKEYKDECISGFKNCPPDLIWLANDIGDKRIRVEFVVVCEFSRISRNIKISTWFQKELEISNIKLISLFDSCRYQLNGTCSEKESLLFKKNLRNLFNTKIGDDYE